MMRSLLHRALLGTAACALLGAFALAQDTGGNGKAEAPRYQDDIFPPWQHGANNDATNRGFDFTVPEVDVLGQQALTLLMPMQLRAQHREDRDIGNRHCHLPAWNQYPADFAGPMVNTRLNPRISAICH